MVLVKRLIFRRSLIQQCSLFLKSAVPLASLTLINSYHPLSSCLGKFNSYSKTRSLFSDPKRPAPDNLTENRYHQLADETLDSLCDYFEKLSDMLGKNSSLDVDVAYSMGVLTISLTGSNNATFVINKQTPNKQIWLSSPFSGPKRYDFCSGKWLYMHDGSCLHDLLTEEISSVFGDEKIDFGVCAYGK